MKIAAVVVLYHPETTFFDCVLSYIDQVSQIYLVDNSETPGQSQVIKKFCCNKHISYHPLHDNCGIAKALNIGASLAIDDGYDLLLTMDQDSTAAPEMVDKLNKAGSKLGWGNIAIISPMHRIGFEHEKPEGDYYDVNTAWTSGCLLHLANYRAIGSFDDKLFIDFVDHEYCLRSKNLGYRIIKVQAAELHHDIGNSSRTVHVLNRPVIITNHSPLRRYYITRNRFYVTKLYQNKFQNFYWIDKLRFFCELIVILLFEEQKFLKIKMIGRGVIDYFLGNFGKYRNG